MPLPVVSSAFLARFVAAGAFEAADVQVAEAVGRLIPGSDDLVLLATALAVWATRHEHVCIDLRSVPDCLGIEGPDPDADPAPDGDGAASRDPVPAGALTRAPLPWPDHAHWVATLRDADAVGHADGPPHAWTRPLVLDGDRLYLQRYWRFEQAVGRALIHRAEAAREPTPVGADAAFLDTLFPAPSATTGAPATTVAALADGRLFAVDGGPGAPSHAGAPVEEQDLQRSAAEVALTSNLTIIAGGPGTGKTRTIARFLLAAQHQASAAGRELEVALTAPTGKAASRMTEAVHASIDEVLVEARRHEGDTDGAPWSPSDHLADVAERVRGITGSTIHRLLGATGGLEFRHDRDHPLPHDVVVVDEASMISLPLMARLLAAVRPNAKVVLVGDPNQLESIEVGAVFADVVGPDAPRRGPLADNLVVLRTVHRQREGSTIIDLAEAIRRGAADDAIELLRSGGRQLDDGAFELSWHRPGDRPGIAALERILADNAAEVVGAALADDPLLGLAATTRVKVLAATRHGAGGAHEWRDRIERLVSARQPLLRPGRRWYVGQPVIVTHNDYLHRLFNGETGLVVGSDRQPEVAFPSGDGVRRLAPSQLADIETWWAMTIHKSQGSEFAHAVVSLPLTPAPVLSRELLYTGITRAKERLTLVADEEVLRHAIANPVSRASGLTDLLWG